MKNNTKYLIIALGCVVVLGGAVAALTLTGGSSEDTASSQASSAAETIPLIEKTEEDLAGMTVTNETGSFTVRAHTETVVASAASSEEDASSESEPEETTEVVYEVDELDGIAFDSSSVSSLARAGYSLTAQRSIGTVEDLTDFGLVDPAATVEVVYQDGSTFSYKVGGENSGYYYVMVDGSDEVYLASVNSSLFDSCYELADTTLLELEIGEDTSSAASIAQSVGTYSDAAIINTLHLSGAAFEREITLEYDGSVGYVMTEPRRTDADSTKASNIAQALTSLSADSLVLPHPSEDDLAEYGLAEPDVVCEFTSGGKDYVLTVSATDSDGNRYITLDSIDAIFLISNDKVTAWADADPFYLQSTLTLLPNIVDVRTMTFTMNGKEYQFTIDRAVDEEESTEDETAYTYTVKNADGLELDYEENFKHFYLAFISITVSEDTWEEPTGDPVLTCTYTYQDKEGSDTIEYYKVSDRRYAIVENGQLMGLALSDTVDLAMKDLELLNAGETVPDPN